MCLTNNGIRIVYHFANGYFCYIGFMDMWLWMIVHGDNLNLFAIDVPFPFIIGIIVQIFTWFHFFRFVAHIFTYL